MKRIRLAPFASVFVLSLCSLFVLSPKTFAATFTWSGTAGDHKFSTATNWVGNAAPANGDDLVFPASATDMSPDNDMVGATFASISFTGNGGGYTITGQDISLSGGITSNTDSYDEIDLNITLTASQVFSKTSTSSSGLLIGGAPAANTLNLGANQLTINAVNVTGGSGITISSDITGNGTIVSNSTIDAGNGLIADSPTYDGAIQLQSGVLSIFTVKGLGTAVGDTTISSGANLNILLDDRTISAINEPFTISGDGYAPDPSIPELVTGAITNIDYCTTGCTGTSVDLTGAMTLAADTKLASFGLELKVSGALSGTHTLGIVDGVTGTLNVAASPNTSSTANGIKSSARAVVTINSGSSSPSTNLFVDGNQTFVVNGVRGNVDVSIGGILQGSGTVGDVFVDLGGILAPGNSPGCLNTGNLTLNGTLNEELGGAAACTGYDQTKVTGTVDVTGSTLNTSLYGGFVPAAGQTYTIIDNDGADAVTGTFTGLAEGATFTQNGTVLKVSYVGGTGNDVVLSVVTAPGAVKVPNSGLGLLRSNPVYPAVFTLASAVLLAVQLRRKMPKSVKALVKIKK